MNSRKLYKGIHQHLSNESDNNKLIIIQYQSF
jgi:hypothetical protein